MFPGHRHSVSILPQASIGFYGLIHASPQNNGYPHFSVFPTPLDCKVRVGCVVSSMSGDAKIVVLEQTASNKQHDHFASPSCACLGFVGRFTILSSQTSHYVLYVDHRFFLPCRTIFFLFNIISYSFSRPWWRPIPSTALQPWI